jgi:rubrerythrin
VDWRLFVSTFLLIFLAELGDKTQLAVMSQSAASSSRWTVFCAGALALAASTAIGVLCGSVLRRWVPDDRYIKVSGGVLFLVFGALMLREGLRARPAAAVPAAETAPVGALGRFVLAQAARFERAAFDDYRKLAAVAITPAVRALFEALAAEEEEHFRRLDTMQSRHADTFAALGATLPAPSGEDPRLHDVAIATDRPVLEHAIEHEEATAGFYRELAAHATLPGLKNAFASLAAAEEGHAARMRRMLTQQG